MSPESQRVERKASWRDEYLKWVCGFANADGGVLVVGKDDRGVPVGVEHAEKLMENLPNKVRDVLGLLVDVNLVVENEASLVEIVLDSYPYPVSYKGRYFQRSGSTNQEVKGAALDRFLLERQGKHWDELPVVPGDAGELDERVLTRFRERAEKSQRLSSEVLKGADEVLVERLRLLDGGRVKRAAWLLFHADPETRITGAYVKIGYFEGVAELRYQDEIHGDLFTQVEQSIDLLRTKYLKGFVSYTGNQRVETIPVPEEALREAVTNAVAHKATRVGCRYR